MLPKFGVISTVKLIPCVVVVLCVTLHVLTRILGKRRVYVSTYVSLPKLMVACYV